MPKRLFTYEPKRASYYGMVENIDDNLGLLMEKLDEWGISENTILNFIKTRKKPYIY